MSEQLRHADYCKVEELYDKNAKLIVVVGAGQINVLCQYINTTLQVLKELVYFCWIHFRYASTYVHPKRS